MIFISDIFLTTGLAIVAIFEKMLNIFYYTVLCICVALRTIRTKLNSAIIVLGLYSLKYKAKVNDSVVYL